MKIPSEAELIEMERRALVLVPLVGTLDRRADNEWNKADGEENDRVSAELYRKSKQTERQARALEGLISNIESLVEIARAVRSGEPVRHL